MRRGSVPASGGSITGNTVKTCGGSGIVINNSSFAGSVKSNKIIGVTKHGIFLNISKLSGDIIQNTIDSAAYGININSSSTVGGVISDNVITNAITRDIRVSADSKATIVISEEPEEADEQQPMSLRPLQQMRALHRIKKSGRCRSFLFIHTCCHKNTAYCDL